MANSFEVRENARQQHLKERPAPAAAESASVPPTPTALALKPKKRRKQTYTVYLDRELMGRVQRVAQQKDVAASAVIEVCISIAIDQLEG